MTPTLGTTTTLLLAACALATGQTATTGGGGTGRHRAVLELQPTGYWPGDDGEGEVLHDRSGNDNHGKILHTPWEDGLLDFTGGF